MIVSLTGRLAEALPTLAVLDVSGIGFELGISGTTAAALPAVGTDCVTLLVRMVVRENSVELFGFATREERSMFDRLVSISGVGPKLALSVLTTFTPAGLVNVVMAEDLRRMATVAGVGKKMASRLVMELADLIAKDPSLRSLAGAESQASIPARSARKDTDEQDAIAALLSMGFTSQEAELALEGHNEAAVQGVEQILAYALRRLGGRS